MDAIEANTLLPMDDLYWNDLEEKYTALSPDEIDLVLTALFDDGLDHDEEGDPCEHDVSQALKVLDWATHVRTGNLLLQGVISGRLDIGIGEDEDSPRFSVREIEDEQTDDDSTVE